MLLAPATVRRWIALGRPPNDLAVDSLENSGDAPSATNAHRNRA